MGEVIEFKLELGMNVCEFYSIHIKKNWFIRFIKSKIVRGLKLTFMSMSNIRHVKTKLFVTL